MRGGGNLCPFVVDANAKGHHPEGRRQGEPHDPALRHRQQQQQQKSHLAPSSAATTTAQQQQHEQQQERRIIFLSAWGTQERAEWVDALSRCVYMFVDVVLDFIGFLLRGPTTYIPPLSLFFPSHPLPPFSPACARCLLPFVYFRARVLLLAHARPE